MTHSPSRAALNRMLAYRHPGVYAKLAEELNYAPEAAERLFVDTLRFLALAGDPETRARTMTLATTMGYTVNRTHVCIAPTRAIDEAWHRFVLFTHDYARFCSEHFGKFLHHQPIANPAQLEQVVRGDDLIRIAQTVYGDDLDLTNWRGDSTNSGTCCIGESANCDVCWDNGTHCYACCAQATCTVCPAFRARITAARRAWNDAEQRRSSAEHAIKRPRWMLQDKIQEKEQRLRTRRAHLAEYLHEIRDIEPRLLKLRTSLANCERELQALEQEIPELKAQLPDADAAVAKARAGAFQDIEVLARSTKDAHDRLLRAHRDALKVK